MIVRINPLTTSSAQSFGSKKNVIKSAVDAGASAVQQSKPLHKGVMGKVGLPLALAAMVLAGAAALTSCDTGNGPVPDETIEEPADPTPTDPSNPTDPTDPTDPAGIVLTESQQAIMDSILSNAVASNAIIQTNSTARSVSREAVSGIPKNISYTDPTGYIYNLTLDEEQLSSDAEVVTYSGTRRDDIYDETTEITRTYFNLSNLNTVQYRDSDSCLFTEIQNSDHIEEFRDNEDTLTAIKTPTANPGEMTYTNPYGEIIGTGLIKGYTIVVE